MNVGFLPGLFDRPTGEAARHLGDIFLRVAAVDAERVQLHQFAAVVFVEAARTFFRLLRARSGSAEASPVRLLARCSLCGCTGCGVRIGTQIVVEIKKHRRAFRSGIEQVFEFFERVRLDDVAFVGRHEPFHVALAGEHVEMVEPEIVHNLLELAFAVDREGDLGHREFFSDALRFVTVVGDGARDGVGIDG